MRKASSILIFLAAIFVIAACAAALSVALTSRREKPPAHDAHEWIHKQLKLTSGQDAALEPIEKRYREQRLAIEHRMRLGNKELAGAILADGRSSQRVTDAIERIHADMGELQKVTIAHVFEMRDVLTPEQYARLLKSTAAALDQLDSRDGHR